MSHIFECYESAVLECWNEDSLSKTVAIQLNEKPRPGLISAAQIKGFYDALDQDDCWRKNNGSNWEWRAETPLPRSERNYQSDEVKLERDIARIDADIWTCQMSTSSGTQGRLHRRRAIDLVRYNGSGSFAFIELKIGSDNPLYATFEILGYALTYLHARVNLWAGRGRYNVMDATKIELTVLGPKHFYEYTKRRQSTPFKFRYDWLEKDIESALNSFVTSEMGTHDLQFAFTYRSFDLNAPIPTDKKTGNEWWLQSGTEL